MWVVASSLLADRTGQTHYCGAERLSCKKTETGAATLRTLHRRPPHRSLCPAGSLPLPSSLLPIATQRAPACLFASPATQIVPVSLDRPFLLVGWLAGWLDILPLAPCPKVWQCTPASTPRPLPGRPNAGSTRLHAPLAAAARSQRHSPLQQQRVSHSPCLPGDEGRAANGITRSPVGRHQHDRIDIGTTSTTTTTTSSTTTTALPSTASAPGPLVFSRYCYFFFFPRLVDTH